MTDITKCTGDGCPLKAQCRRYTAPASYWQVWLIPHWEEEDCMSYLEEQSGDT